ncbi:hypothetical protein GPUN_0512 [Glaciecola punicea ACAM 611]|uniref:Uncharacterized protein n=1 Tax=Glaciecola punicea ACAM 611 TaxID=1121923 RepID=H5T8L7_9ALTE|nr:hypothetical protein [Glaciecola punicea]GAB54658.1 hypothetical protein GPUN_0512 [Glaciecola punicea ACAM 611]
MADLKKVDEEYNAVLGKYLPIVDKFLNAKNKSKSLKADDVISTLINDGFFIYDEYKAGKSKDPSLVIESLFKALQAATYEAERNENGLVIMEEKERNKKAVLLVRERKHKSTGGRRGRFNEAKEPEILKCFEEYDKLKRVKGNKLETMASNFDIPIETFKVYRANYLKSKGKTIYKE